MEPLQTTISKPALRRLANLPLAQQEQEALNLSLEQLLTLQGKEDFRDFYNSSQFWRRKIRHDFPATQLQEIKDYNVEQLQAHYRELLAEYWDNQALQIDPKRDPEYQRLTDRELRVKAAALAPNASKQFSVADRLLDLTFAPSTARKKEEIEAQYRAQRQDLLRRAEGYRREANRLFIPVVDRQLYTVTVTDHQWKAFRENFSKQPGSFMAYFLEKYLNQHLLEEGTDFKLLSEQLIEIRLEKDESVEDVPEALIYVYSWNTRYWVELSFRQGPAKIVVPTALKKVMSKKAIIENYGMSYPVESLL